MYATFETEMNTNPVEGSQQVKARGRAVGVTRQVVAHGFLERRSVLAKYQLIYHSKDGAALTTKPKRSNESEDKQKSQAPAIHTTHKEPEIAQLKIFVVLLSLMMELKTPLNVPHLAIGDG